jgi:hypothetical protein
MFRLYHVCRMRVARLSRDLATARWRRTGDARSHARALYQDNVACQHAWLAGLDPGCLGPGGLDARPRPHTTLAPLEDLAA